MTKSPPIRILQLVCGYSFLTALIACFYVDVDFAVSILLGGLMMFLNFLSLAFFWRLIFLKKSIALAVFIIIFKYVILAGILWGLAAAIWLKPVGFLLGMTSLVFAAITVKLK